MLRFALLKSVTNIFSVEALTSSARPPKAGEIVEPSDNESGTGSWAKDFLAVNKDPEAHQQYLDGLKATPVRHPDKFAIKLEEVLTQEECKFLIDRCEQKGFEPALLNVGFGRQVLDLETRNNERCIHDDKELCKVLWKRMEPHVAQVVHHDRYTGKWVPHELNERLRVLKYTSEPGNPNYFRAHFDGEYHRPNSHPDFPDQSRYTVLIYLNGGYEGGSTRLYKSSYDDKDYEDCVPSAGRILIHDHKVYHEGMPVGENTGTKYVIRTDLMCSKAEQ